MKLEDGEIYYIDFKGNVGHEINKIHLGVIYKLPSIKDIVLCIPLTSPKIKHFKTKKILMIEIILKLNISVGNI